MIICIVLVTIRRFVLNPLLRIPAYLGRARAMALTTVVCIVGVIIQTFAVHIAMMIVGR